jgi:CheY-like chemotaxis protein
VVHRLLGEDRQLVVVVDASPQVWVDPGQLEQVLVNLVLNARDATPPGGTITIIVSESTLPHASAAAYGAIIPAGWYATLAVRDTGTGMDAETQAHIFDPFFTTKSTGKGTGLGLAAGLGIVTQNGGYITVISAPGQGAAFTLYLPALPAADIIKQAEEPPPVGADATYAGATVLVVDDEAVVRGIVARSLERCGFRIFQAADGADALELVERQGPPHLVLTDVLMPGIGGGELARRLRARWPTLPILFMSGYSAEELGRRGAIASEGDVLQKPFTLGRLVESVTKALSRAEVR